MKAWYVQDNEGEYQEIVFADKRSDAIQKSEAIGWTEYINVRAKRAKYADGLENEPEKLIQIQLENGWWLECRSGKCTNQICEETNYTIANNEVYCEECSKKL